MSKYEDNVTESKSCKSVTLIGTSPIDIEESPPLQSDTNKVNDHKIFTISDSDEETLVSETVDVVTEKSEKSCPGGNESVVIVSSPVSEKVKVQDCASKEANELEIIKELGSSDKDNCSICLGAFTNRSFLDDCFHAFCYYCILQWSEISQTCPLCKKSFSKIIHDVKSITEYKETHVTKDEPAIIPPNRRNAFRQTVRYRTTADDQIRHDSTTTRVPGDVINIRDGPVARKRRKRSGPSEDEQLKEARLRVYTNDLYAKIPTKSSGNHKRRKATPEFFMEFQGAKHRLFPWVKNELEVLLYNNHEHVLFVMEVIWKLLDMYHIKSEEFRSEIQPFLFEKTDQFCHELYAFATSPFDFKTYLKKVQYDDNTGTSNQASGTSNSTVSRWDSSPVRYIGETVGSKEGDTISQTRWDEEEEGAVRRSSKREDAAVRRSSNSSVEFIEEKEREINIESDSSFSGDESTSPKLLRISKSTTQDTPIIIDGEMATPPDTRQKPGATTPVYLTLDDIPPTPSPPARHGSPARHNSPASPLRTRHSSPVRHNSPVRNNSPVQEYERTPSPVLKGKGKEKRKRKKRSSPATIDEVSLPDNLSLVRRVAVNENEPCSSRHLI